MKTYNKQPWSVKQYDYDDLNYQFFNHSNWKGLCDNKNYIGVDQETFEECNNVYIDKNALLSSRPAIKRDTHFNKTLTIDNIAYQISNAYPFGEDIIVLEYIHNTQKYLYFINNKFTDNKLLYINVDDYKLIDEDNKIFVFADNQYAYYDKITNNIYSSKNTADRDKIESTIYVPTTKIWDGTTFIENESPNEFTSTESTVYTYTNLSSLPNDIYGKSIIIQIGDAEPITIDNFQKDDLITLCTYKFTIDNENRLPDAYYTKHSTNTKYPMLFITDDGKMVLCRCVQTGTDNTDYNSYSWTISWSVSGSSFNELLENIKIIGLPAITKDNTGVTYISATDGKLYYRELKESSSNTALSDTITTDTNFRGANALYVKSSSDDYGCSYTKRLNNTSAITYYTAGIYLKNKTYNGLFLPEFLEWEGESLQRLNLGNGLTLSISSTYINTIGCYQPIFRISNTNYLTSYLAACNLQYTSDNIFNFTNFDVDNYVGLDRLSLCESDDFSAGSVTLQQLGIHIYIENIEYIVGTRSDDARYATLKGTVNKPIRVRVIAPAITRNNPINIVYLNGEQVAIQYIAAEYQYKDNNTKNIISGQNAPSYNDFDNKTTSTIHHKLMVFNLNINKEGSGDTTDRYNLIFDNTLTNNTSSLLYYPMDIIEDNLVVVTNTNILQYSVNAIIAKLTHSDDTYTPISNVTISRNSNLMMRFGNNSLLSNYLLYTNIAASEGKTYNTNDTILPIAYAKYSGDTSGDAYIYYIDKDNKVFSSYLTGNTVVTIWLKNSTTKINYLVPSAVTKLDNYYFANDNKLYISATGADVNSGEFKWYFPKKQTQLFVDNITNLHPISKDDVGIFFSDHINYVHREINESAIQYYYYVSKIQLGCDFNTDILTTYDGKYIIFATTRGIVALSYQNFVATDEQTLTYLSDNIFATYSDWNISSIKLLQYEYWILCYRQDSNIAFIYDTRNASWWPMTYDITTKVFVFKNKLHIVSNNDIFVLDTAYNNYKDTIGTISWSFKSQKLHFSALNYYKHINNITLNNVADNGTCTMILKLKAYRKVMNESKDLVFDIPINFIRTFVKHLTILKTNEFQYELSSDNATALNSPLRLSNITIKYKITGQVR